MLDTSKNRLLFPVPSLSFDFHLDFSFLLSTVVTFLSLVEHAPFKPLVYEGLCTITI
jgi:hypothetical protein